MTYPRPNASDALVWQCIKKDSAFLRKFGKFTLSAEKNNLTGVHSQRTSGVLSNSVGVYLCKGRKIRGSRTTKHKSHPSRRVQTVSLSSNAADDKSNKKLEMLAAVRPDLKADMQRKLRILSRV
eukprot:Gregarina_sp_Pseudo_9__3572@NODE_3732_length_572_cov_174_135084_g3416_i0_p1_GENE_NODE_3732_length_572_cov_174_135084_g3416_i0NODE_3732_length_572_cov_174_135084_g3416_i0_p1_ORF_typecomplete_len124_score34_74Ribosomal_L28e/PF01778_17/4_2e13_NODE_3732_length_572_cov_174_135084_g3416_i0125496